MRLLSILCASAFGALFSLSAMAAPSGLAADLRVGSPDVAIDVRGDFIDHVQWRVGAAYGDQDTQRTFRQKEFGVEWERRELSAAFEIAPFNNGFRGVVGLTYDMTRLMARNQPTTQTIVVNHHTYPLPDVGGLGATMRPDSRVTPYLGLGWRGALPVAGWSWGVEAGALAQTYTGTVHVSCGASLDASECTRLQADAASEQGRLNHSLSKVDWVPSASFGVSRSF